MDEFEYIVNLFAYLGRVENIGERTKRFTEIAPERVEALSNLGHAEEMALLGLEAVLKNKWSRLYVSKQDFKKANEALDEEEKLLDRMEELFELSVEK